MLAALARVRRATVARHPDRQRALARPVVSIGNLSMGGTGKTPLVAHVARLLQQQGHTPAILSRGYARPRMLEGAVVVSDGCRVLAGYQTAGDEPLMLARQLPGCIVVVAADRYLAGALAERRFGCTAHILDDGFQHLRLARALDILVVSRQDLDARIMPFGALREPLDAVGAADAVVVPAREGTEDSIMKAGARRVFVMSRELVDRRGEPTFAFAGIGRPQQFFEALERAGWVVAGRAAFPDHHRYSRSDLARIAAQASRAGAALLVTTEKDAARLESLESPMPLVPVSQRVRIDPAEEFAALLRDACGEPPQ